MSASTISSTSGRDINPLRLVQSEVLKRWEAVYKKGTKKDYPSLEVVRLENWFFGHPREGELLEYACGTGVNTLHLLKCGYRVTAVDAARGALRAAKAKTKAFYRGKKRIHFQKISPQAEELPFASNRFDFIVAVSILSLLGSKKRTCHLLREFRRVLRPGGKIIVDINDHKSEFSADRKKASKNVFFFSAGPRDREPVKCFCLRNQQEFRKLVSPFFEIKDSGYTAHKLFGRRICEFVICGVKRNFVEG